MKIVEMLQNARKLKEKMRNEFVSLNRVKTPLLDFIRENYVTSRKIFLKNNELSLFFELRRNSINDSFLKYF